MLAMPISRDDGDEGEDRDVDRRVSSSSVQRQAITTSGKKKLAQPTQLERRGEGVQAGWQRGQLAQASRS